MKQRIPESLRALVLIVAVVLVTSVAAAQMPTQIPFQGLLLDSGGAPITDVVDLDFSLYSDLVGGTVLWSESHVGVSVVDGVYSVNLGAMSPLSVGALPDDTAYLEIVVDGETMTPRQQLRPVPYALLADKANQVGDVSSDYFAQILYWADLDGGDPPNLAPSEGLADVDGDLIANFMDPDNDGDGYSDVTELANGTDINVPNVRITDVSPSGDLPTYETHTFQVTGTNLGAVNSVQIGADIVTPTSVSATSVEFDYMATVTGRVDVTVSTPSGDATTETRVADFVNFTIQMDAIHPVVYRYTHGGTVTLRGQDFLTTMVVHRDGAPVAWTYVSSTEAIVPIIPPIAPSILFEVFHPSDLITPDDAQTIGVAPAASKLMFTTVERVDGDFGGIAVADAICQGEATTYQLSGIYKAWLSDTTTSPSMTFVQSTDPYYNLEGDVVATDWADLLTGIDAGITTDANGGPSAWAWTATGPFGTGFVGPFQNCADWTTTTTDPTLLGRVGIPSTVSGDTWTSFQSTFCNQTHAFICVEQ